MTPSAHLAAAIDLLAAIEAAPTRPADAVANDFFRARRFIGAGDRRAISDRTWHVLRHRRRLQWWLAPAHPSPRLLVATSALFHGIDLHALELLFSGERFAPEPLARPEIDILKRLGRGSVTAPDQPLAVRLECPDWIIPALEHRFGPELEAEMTAALDPAPLDLRVNTLKATRDAAQAALAAEDLHATPTPLSPWGLRLSARRPVTAAAAFKEGLVEIQDEGSQLLAALVAPQPGERVVDYCAGAGGKTLALAMQMHNRGHIVACDVSEPRLEGAIRRLRRAGIHNVERHLLSPGDKWAKRRAGTFDRVLVDAPCTGTGTWRRNPDARHRLTQRTLDELLPKQAAILDSASRLVRPGGRLIFATCSLLIEENEFQVEAFMHRSPDFRLVPLQDAWTISAPPNPGPYLSLTPRRHKTDAFFAATLERVP